MLKTSNFLSVFMLIGMLTACSTNKNNNPSPILRVTKIEDGKDGYTASLIDEKKGAYTMLVSIPNMRDQYVGLNVGDKIKVDGDFAESDPVQIFPKSIQVISKAPEEEIKESKTVIGKVEAINNGKDGYTAKIKDANGTVYSVTISIPNLGQENAYQYRSVNIGETIEIEGESWKLGEENRITVRKLLSTTSNIMVASKEVDCEGVAPQKCLLVKKSGQKDWEYFYDSIEGFDYEAGFEYELEIKEIPVKDPPADASSIRTILVKQVSKTKKG